MKEYQQFFILGLAAMVFVGLFSGFFPSFYASSDEHGYVLNATLLHQGTIVTSEPLLYCNSVQIGENSYLSKYPIGKSLALFPFSFGNFNFLFLAGAIVHLINYFLLILILRRKNINPLYAILYLFFPTFQWEARTLFPELTVLPFLFGAYLLWLKENRRATIGAGVLLGAAIFVRYDAGLALAAFAAYALLTQRSRLLWLLLGAAGPLVAFMGMNAFLYGGPFQTGYGTADSILSNFPAHPQYLIQILTPPFLVILVLPLSLIGLLWYRPKDWLLFAILSGATFLFFGRFYSFWAMETDLIHIFTASMRYFVPLLGLLFIPTIEFYDGIVRHTIERFSLIRQNRTLLLVLLGIGILAGSFALHSTHASFLNERNAVLQAIHSNIPENSYVIGSADDCMFFVPYYFGNKYYAQAANLSAGFPLTPQTYVLDISFSTQQKSGVSRDEVIERERQKVKEFIQKYRDKLTPIYSNQEGTVITIWKFK